MKLLLNATTLNTGGALQAAVNFIEQALFDDTVDWHFAVSKQVMEQLSAATKIPLKQQSFSIFNKSPSKNLLSRKNLVLLEKQLNPQAVFTLFGPAYVKFRSTHIMGFAEPWVTHPNEHALSIEQSPLKRIIRDLHTSYKRKWLAAADAWLVEAEISKRGIIKILGCEEKHVAVLPNGCRDIYQTVTTRANFVGEDSVLKILYISAYYPHKNFEIIPLVAKELKKVMPSQKFKFTLTIDSQKEEVKKIINCAENLGVSELIEFIGQVPVAVAPNLYRESHIAFIPSLLETYSATYSEAMTCGLPIVTSELDFATAICGNAATYFAPNNAKSAAMAIKSIATDSTLRKKNIDSGISISRNLPSGQNKYNSSKNFVLKTSSSRT